MKIVAISDTHWYYGLYDDLPPGDILIIAGDYTSHGSLMDLITFLSRITILKQKGHYRHVIITPGNHNLYEEENPDKVPGFMEKAGVIYLVDDLCTIDGLTFYGTPWSPMFNNWAFMAEEDELVQKFKKIPKNIDVLITHSPPFGTLDLINGRHLGSKALEQRVLFTRPKIHIFGHLHDAHGIVHSKHTDFYNVSMLNDGYQAVFKPTIIEL